MSWGALYKKKMLSDLSYGVETFQWRFTSPLAIFFTYIITGSDYLVALFDFIIIERSNMIIVPYDLITKKKLQVEKEITSAM